MSAGSPGTQTFPSIIPPSSRFMAASDAPPPLIPPGKTDEARFRRDPPDRRGRRAHAIPDDITRLRLPQLMEKRSSSFLELIYGRFKLGLSAWGQRRPGDSQVCPGSPRLRSGRAAIDPPRIHLSSAARRHMIDKQR